MEVTMKKRYKLSVIYDDEMDEIDNLSEIVEDIKIPDQEGIWLETDDGATIQLPVEIAKYIDQDGILGIA